MKKTISIYNIILLVSVLFLPVAKLLCSGFGYTFNFVSNTVYSLVITLLLLVAVILNVIAETTLTNKLQRILFAIIMPLYLLGCFCYIFEINTQLLVGCIVLSASCCCVLTIKLGNPLALKVVALTISALMLVLLVFLGFIGFIFGNIGVDTVVKSVDSPNGKYCAEVISSDQGALGGDTVVKVSRNTDLINAFVFKVSKKPEVVYFGEWYEYKSISVYWKNDSCLIINSNEYEIN